MSRINPVNNFFGNHLRLGISYKGTGPQQVYPTQEQREREELDRRERERVNKVYEELNATRKAREDEQKPIIRQKAEEVTSQQLQEMQQVYAQTQQPQESLAVVARLPDAFKKLADGSSWRAVREQLPSDISAEQIDKALAPSFIDQAESQALRNRVQLWSLWKIWLLAELDHVKRALLDSSTCDEAIDLLRSLRDSNDLTLAEAIGQAAQDPQLSLRYIELLATLLNDANTDRCNDVCHLIESQFLHREKWSSKRFWIIIGEYAVQVATAYIDLLLTLQNKAASDPGKSDCVAKILEMSRKQYSSVANYFMNHFGDQEAVMHKYVDLLFAFLDAGRADLLRQELQPHWQRGGFTTQLVRRSDFALTKRYVTLLSRLEKEDPEAQDKTHWNIFVNWARQLNRKDLLTLMRDVPLPTFFLEQLKDKKEALRDYIILELEPRTEALEIAKQIKDFDKNTHPSTLGEFFRWDQRLTSCIVRVIIKDIKIVSANS